jgi:hypothetical protein
VDEGKTLPDATGKARDTAWLSGTLIAAAAAADSSG